MDDKYIVIVVNGLRIHNVHKNAHSSINLAVRNIEHRLETPSDVGDEYRFMVVRHPLDRIVSAWAFFCQKDKRQLHDYMKIIGYYMYMPFDEWLELLLISHPKNVHTQKQVIFTGGHKIDELCPIEKLNAKWSSLAERFGLGELPEKHNPSTHNHWSSYYTDEQRARAEEVFKEDLELYHASLKY